MEDETNAVPFKEVRQKEWAQIQERRAWQLYTGRYLSSGDVENSNPPQSLVGLALSGGGIRSATFCLGLLQGMDKLKLLRIFDYLSTVSGGGYVGGWWSAWLARDGVNPCPERAFPFLRPEDIKTPSGLASKLLGRGDAVSAKLWERFSPATKEVLSRFADHDISGELEETLVRELNLAIADNFFAPRKPPVRKADGESSDSDQSDASYSSLADRLRYFLQVNRLLLEEAFPYEIEASSYEIKDIFPPREQIESERPRNASPDAARKEVEGSTSAWRDPVHHLRLFASYLTPRKGMLSADTWRAVSVVTRNLTLTWLILLPVLIAIVLAGQLYFQVMYDVNDAFAHTAHVQDKIPSLTVITGTRLDPDKRLIYLAIPVAALLGWIVWMAVLWLLFSTERFTINGLVIQTICLFAVGTLVYAGMSIHPPLQETITGWWKKPSVRIGLALWATVTAILTLWAIKPPSTKDLPGDQKEIKSEWKRQVRRNLISRIHTKLMIALAVLTIVLLFSGFGHWSLEKLFQISGVRFPIALLPLLSAFAGSIFTAFKSTPMGGGDKMRIREPSFINRFIFAVTPGLMVAVLAVGAAWLGDELLRHISADIHKNQIGILLVVAIFDGIFLCFALAIYEMSWNELHPSWSLLSFSCLAAFTISWVVSEIAEYGNDPAVENRGWISLIPWAIFAAILVMAFTRIFGNRRWKWWLEKIRDFQGSPWQVSAMIVILVVTVLFVIASWRTGRRHLNQDIAILMTAVAVLTGGLILFRLAVARKGASQKFELKKLLKTSTIGRRRENLWLLASLCLALPVIAGGLLHRVLPAKEHYGWWLEIAMTILLGVLVGFLPQILILFRTLVVFVKKGMMKAAADKKKKEEETPAVVMAPGFIERALHKVPGIPRKSPSTFRMIACYAIGFALAAGFTTEALGRTDNSPQGILITLSPAAVFIAFVLSLIMFQLAVVRMPVEQGAEDAPHLKLTRKKWIREHSQFFLWVLAGCCILIAFLIGYLLNLSLNHIGDNSPQLTQLSRLALPGLIVCFAIVVFEMWWGKGNNRRTLWLVASAYAALAALFLIGVAFPDYDKHYPIKILLTVFGLLAAVLVWIVALGWMVDPNAVSMHQFYKGRLVRAYLGASNARRLDERKEITEAVAGDDVPLTMLKNCQRGAPYHLINTTLNLVAGRDLTTAQRSASSFVLAQSYCGSSRTLYRPTAEYMSGRLTLGAAVAASGAAVSPSMGAKKPTAALAMLMTLLNVRLGYWAPTPNQENWKLSQPRLWPFYLLREFLSQTNDLSSYCYLTDGGHFDNTGLYSLVERGCRYIVMADCGADPQPCFEDLGDAIRRCRIDFGTEIELDIEPFLNTEAEDEPQQFVVGTIKYSRKHIRWLGWEPTAPENSDEERKERTGIIIYFKPRVQGKVTADVRQYAIENKHFPQQSTANQWFDEAQFESYRRLGQTCAEKAFAGLDASAHVKNRAKLWPEDIKAIFVEAEKNFNDERSAALRAKRDKDYLDSVLRRSTREMIGQRCDH